MYKDEDLVNKIASKWSGFEKDWDKDLVTFLKNTKDQVITFKTHTPTFNDGDPCTTHIDGLYGSVYLDIDNGHIYKALGNGDPSFICAKIYQLDEYESNEPKIECKMVDIDEFIKNDWISNEQVKYIKDLEISWLNYKLSEYSREYGNEYRINIEKLQKSFGFSDEVLNFLMIRMLDIIPDNNFGYLYLDGDVVKHSSEWICPD